MNFGTDGKIDEPPSVMSTLSRFTVCRGSVV